MKGTQMEEEEERYSKSEGQAQCQRAEGGRCVGSTQNMVVSYLVLMVLLESLGTGSTSHVALPWDWESPTSSNGSTCRGRGHRGGQTGYKSDLG